MQFKNIISERPECIRDTYGTGSCFTYWARLKTSQCKYHICLNSGKLFRCCKTRWNWVSLQEFFYDGFQRSVPSSTAMYLVESASNFVIGHSAEKCEHAIFGSYVLLFKNCYLHAKLLVLTSVQGFSYENEEFCSTCLASHTHAVNLPRGISLHKNAQPYDQETQNLVSELYFLWQFRSLSTQDKEEFFLQTVYTEAAKWKL